VNGWRAKGAGSCAEPRARLQPLRNGRPDVEPCSGDVGCNGEGRRGRPSWMSSRFADLFFFSTGELLETPGDAKRGSQSLSFEALRAIHGIQSPVRVGIRPVAEWESLWTRSSSPNRCGTIPATWRARSTVESPLSAALRAGADRYPRLAAKLTARSPPGRIRAGIAGDRRTLLVSKGCAGCHRGALTFESHPTATASPTSPPPCGTTPSAPTTTQAAAQP